VDVKQTYKEEKKEKKKKKRKTGFEFKLMN